MVLQAMIEVPLDKYQVMRLRHDLDPILAFLKRPEIYGVTTIRTKELQSPLRGDAQTVSPPRTPSPKSR